MTSQEKARLTALFAETWKDEKMIKYEVNNTFSAFDLRGKTITIEKQKIKTRFCYGYSLSRYDSEDFDRANEMADYASKNQHYFIVENHKNSGYGQLINLMNDSLHWKFYARQHYYTGGISMQ